MTDRKLNVLCYSPYNMWVLHGLWEITILHALLWRGARIRHVLCDGLYTDCDVFWASTNPRTPQSCAQCRHIAGNLSQQMHIPNEWLGQYLLPEEREIAKPWAEGVKVSDFLTATYGDWPVGEWVESSVHSHFRRSWLDMDDPETQAAYRSYLYSGLIACFALSRLLDEAKPDVLFIFNGRMSSTRVAMELAMRRGIRVVCHERGVTREHIQLFADENCVSLAHVKNSWSKWASVPLALGEIEKIHEYMIGRQYGKNISWRTFTPPPQDLEALRQRLGISREKNVWTLFTSSDDELVKEIGNLSPFPAQLEWVERTVAFAERHPEMDLVVKVHPNTGSRVSVGANLLQLQQFTALKARAPRNVHVVMPDDPVSAYSLIDISTLGLSYQSTVGLEAAFKGKPVVVADSCLVSGLSFVHTVEDPRAYESMLEDLLARPVHRAEPGEIRRMAYRFAYLYFFRFDIPFPLVHMPNPHQGALRYTSTDALKPGRDEHLDRIARIILDAEPVIPPPEAECISRSDADESAFFGLISQAALGDRAELDLEAEGEDFPQAGPSIQAPYKLCLVTAAPREKEEMLRWIDFVGARPAFELVMMQEDGAPCPPLPSADRMRIISGDFSSPAQMYNYGLGLARAEYVLIAPCAFSDVEYWIERALSAFEKVPTAGILAPAPGKDPGALPWSAHDGDLTEPIAGIDGPCLMVRSKVLERIGGLDERCGTTKSAFTNFSLRASLTGWETRLCRGGVSRSEAVGKDSSEALGSVIDNWCLHWGLSTGEGAGAEGLISRHHIPLAYPGALLCAETGGNRWKGSRREDLAVLKKRAEISRQGVRLFKEGKLKDAEQCFRRLTSDGTDYPGAHGNLACVLMKLGRLDEALDEMRISRKLEPDDANILWNYGQLLFQAGDGPAALEAYEEYLRVHPQDERIRTGCERLKARVGKG